MNRKEIIEVTIKLYPFAKQLAIRKHFEESLTSNIVKLNYSLEDDIVRIIDEQIETISSSN